MTDTATQTAASGPAASAGHRDQPDQLRWQQAREEAAAVSWRIPILHPVTLGSGNDVVAVLRAGLDQDPTLGTIGEDVVARAVMQAWLDPECRLWQRRPFNRGFEGFDAATVLAAVQVVRHGVATTGATIPAPVRLLVGGWCTAATQLLTALDPTVEGALP